ncbi:unnamed protein product [Penicillium olsonii]|uniref:Glutamate--cysteine ligase n=1 Tax=Penicillium olsonii TaxID=99116 RepID=A0A9W4HYN3_PENOL|nr:unnamed protein product [Penicillium olsonii]CAG8204201.1 unnamed protein product [Penicillium olsonii]
MQSCRRSTVQGLLGSDEIAITIPVFPRLGTARSFTTPDLPHCDNGSHVNLDPLFTSYKRWKCLADNLKSRRQREFELEVPLFQDINTSNGSVLLDHFGYGSGGCALQVTLQAKNIDEACLLHDQLSILGPLMLAMTAGTPSYRGLLTDTDVRWDVLQSLLDDRTPEELLEMNGMESDAIHAKLRGSTSPIYLSESDDVQEHYQSYLARPSEVQDQLKRKGMANGLASHFTHYLQYDPIILEPDHVESFGPEDSYHFSTLYRSAWPHVRLKFPEGKDTGWRLEFRPMEVQLTDFENAAFIAFMVLLRHSIEYYKLNLYIPMRLVVKNMQAAGKRDAVLQEKFWVRSGDCLPKGTRWKGTRTATCSQCSMPEKNSPTAKFEQTTLQEIFCGPIHHSGDGATDGSDAGFPGFIPLIKGFLESISIDDEQKTVLMGYIDFIEKRASGQLWTDAGWIRHVIRSHPSYKNDSVVTEEACYDLCCQIKDVSQGKLRIPMLF